MAAIGYARVSTKEQDLRAGDSSLVSLAFYLSNRSRAIWQQKPYNYNQVI
jgi:hypothetical protein